MTREEKLWTMTAKTLQGVGEKLGVKITDSDIKKGKATIIAKIMAAEAETPVEEVKKEESVEEIIGNDVADLLKGTLKDIAKATEEPVKEPETVEADETKATVKKTSKKTNLKLTELTYKGETKSIKEWAAEINIPVPTLYDRVNRNGWPIDLAIETPLGQRRPKNETLA